MDVASGKPTLIRGYKTSWVQCWIDPCFKLEGVWYETKDGYARSKEFGLMHRYVMGFKKGDGLSHRYVDHIDGNRLNNRKSNLRVVTPKQNAKNKTNDPSIPKSKDHKELFGVAWDAKKNMYATVHKGHSYFWSKTPMICALCYDSIMHYVYGHGKRINDNHSKEPLPLDHWNISKEDKEILDKLKSRYTDFIGVTWCKDGWKAEIKIDLGTFENPEQAAMMYDIALRKIKDNPRPEECNFK